MKGVEHMCLRVPHKRHACFIARRSQAVRPGLSFSWSGPYRPHIRTAQPTLPTLHNLLSAPLTACCCCGCGSCHPFCRQLGFHLCLPLPGLDHHLIKLALAFLLFLRVHTSVNRWNHSTFHAHHIQTRLGHIFSDLALWCWYKGVTAPPPHLT